MVNKKFFKNVIIAICFSATIFSSSSQAGTNKMTYLRAGDTELMISLPAGQCFIDRATSSAETVNSYVRAMAEEGSGEKTMLIAFTDCGNLRKAVEAADPNQLDNSFSFINFLYPEIGITFEGSREEFIEMQKEKFGELPFDEKTENIKASISRSLKMNEETYFALVTKAYTLIKHVPLEIVIMNTTKEKQDGKMDYDDMDKFIKYQIEINE